MFHTVPCVLVEGAMEEPMARIVAKFGGTSVADLDRIRAVAQRVKREYDAGHQMAVVVSAMAGVTNDLVALTREALADVEPVEAGMAVERVEVTVFGNDRTETLASHANAVVAMGGAFAASMILAAMAVSVLIFLFA